MSTTAAGISVTTVSTSAVGALAPLGFRLTEPAASGSDDNADLGEKEWVYILADEALEIGDVVIINTDWANPWHGIQGNGGESRAEVLGVAGHVIASGSFGFVQCRGYATYVKGDGSVAQGEDIVPHTAGKCDTFADGEEEQVIGLALADDAANAAAVVHSVPVFAAMINCGV